MEYPSKELEGKWTSENKEQISTAGCRAGNVVAVVWATSPAYFENSCFQQPDLFFFYAAGMSSSANCYQ